MSNRSTYQTGAGIYLNAWGEVYEWSGGNTSVAKVQIADLQLHLMYSSGQVYRAIYNQACNNGALYYSDFSGQLGSGTGSKTPQSRSAAPDGGTLIRLPDPAGAAGGYNYHFYTTNPGRFNVNSGPQARANLVGVHVGLRARIDPAASAADIAAARYTISVGADAWDDPALAGSTHYKGDIGQGRFKIAKAEWRYYSMTSGPTTGTLPTPAGVLSNQEYVNP